MLNMCKNWEFNKLQRMKRSKLHYTSCVVQALKAIQALKIILALKANQFWQSILKIQIVQRMTVQALKVSIHVRQ